MIPEIIMLVLFMILFKNNYKKKSFFDVFTGMMVLIILLVWGDFFNDLISFFAELLFR